MHSRILFCCEAEWDHDVFSWMYGTGNYSFKESKSDSERQMSHTFSHMQNLNLNTHIHTNAHRHIHTETCKQPGRGQKEKFMNIGVLIWTKLSKTHAHHDQYL